MQQLWHRTRVALEAKELEIRDLRYAATTNTTTTTEALSVQINALEVARDVTVDLKDKLSFTTRQLNHARNENERLGTLVTVMQREAAERSCESEGKNARVRSLEEEVSQLRRRNHALQGRMLEESRLAERERENAHELSARVGAFDSAMSHIRDERAELRRQLAVVTDRLREAEASNAMALQRVEAEAEDLRVGRAAAVEANRLRSELAHVKLDNARLVHLLCSTREFREFKQLWNDSNGVSFVPPFSSDDPASSPRRMCLSPTKNKKKGGSKRGKARGGASGKTSKSVQENAAGWGGLDAMSRLYPGPAGRDGGSPVAPIEAPREAEHWMPQDALRLTRTFVTSHMPHVTSDMIGVFLRSLNETWRQRESRHVARVRRKYVRIVNDLKRQLQQREPFRKVVASNKIDHLKQELRESQTREASIRRRRRAAQPPTSKAQAQLLEASLSTVETLGRQVADYANENQRLQHELYDGAVAGVSTAPQTTTEHPATLLEVTGETPPSHGPGSVAFMAGAVWLGRNMVVLVDDMGEQFNGICSRRNAVGGAGGDALSAHNPDRQTATPLMRQEQFSESASRAVNQCCKRVRAMFERVLEINGGDFVAFHNLNATMPLQGAVSVSSALPSVSHLEGTPLEEGDEDEEDYDDDYDDDDDDDDGW